MSSTDFDPSSPNAMFATILARLDFQDEKMDKILDQTTKTNGRVTALESHVISCPMKGSSMRDMQDDINLLKEQKIRIMGYVAGVSGVVSILIAVASFVLKIWLK